ncbi:MAG TPA: hypothetical protein PK047_03610 [Saprospiraceae bacterium]|nr:hypothetical protein [Saprospiraceae bacterium]HRO07926.1 hypothetical protein [Saprospiraceae bacterium]HRP41421.1 hypothetical protein [Saprospiraceae bacterium]
MHRILLIILLFISGMISWNCKNEKMTGSSEPVSQTVREVQNQNGLIGQIELDNGKKWTVNDEMKPFIAEGEKLVDNYIQSGDDDYIKLAEALKIQNDNLIKSCTMTGKSHDELHKWLEPHQKLIEMIKNLPEKEMAGKVITRLKSSYEIYHSNFQ